MLATHLDAEHRYNDLRRIAYDTAQMGAAPGVRFTGITADAFSSARSWASSPTRQVAWDWFDGYSAFRFRYPKRFELALWSANRLLALSLGRPTYNGNHLRLDLVEAQPRGMSMGSGLVFGLSMGSGLVFCLTTPNPPISLSAGHA